MSALAEARRAPARARDHVAAQIARLPVRMRLTLSFATVMVVLFGLIALALYFIFEAGLDTSINNSLRFNERVIASVVDSRHLQTPLSSKTGQFAQIVNSRSGRVLDPVVGAEP